MKEHVEGGQYSRTDLVLKVIYYLFSWTQLCFQFHTDVSVVHNKKMANTTLKMELATGSKYQYITETWIYLKTDNVIYSIIYCITIIYNIKLGIGMY